MYFVIFVIERTKGDGSKNKNETRNPEWRGRMPKKQDMSFSSEIVEPCEVEYIFRAGIEKEQL